MNKAQTALAWAKTKIGCKYDQNKRMNTNPDIFDCSSLVYRSYKSIGYTMSSSTSCYEVNDPGFDLIWPAKRADIGKKFYKLSEIKASGWIPTPGDLVFYNQKSTDRTNNITHVAFILDSNNILHARNPNAGVLTNSITLYDGSICAVTRFRETNEQTVPAQPNVTIRNLRLESPYMKGDDVNELQTGLTRLGYDCGKIDGIFGSNTDEAVKKFQTDKNLTVDGIVGSNTRRALGI